MDVTVMALLASLVDIAEFRVVKVRNPIKSPNSFPLLGRRRPGWAEIDVSSDRGSAELGLSSQDDAIAT